MKTAFVINGKIKKFPSLLSPESIDDTAFDAVSSKLADYDGGEQRTRTVDLPRVRRTLYRLSYASIAPKTSKNVKNALFLTLLL